MEELRQRLWDVSDAYDSFVSGVIAVAKMDKSFPRRIIRFMDDHPDAESSDVVEFASDLHSEYQYNKLKRLMESTKGLSRSFVSYVLESLDGDSYGMQRMMDFINENPGSGKTDLIKCLDEINFKEDYD